MRLRIRCFGYTVCSVTLDNGPALEILEDDGITGGADVWMERDTEPPDPAERHNHEYEERRLGFN